MSGLFSTFNIARRGMSAQQTALQVTSHNVANANTEGYSVQRADLKTTQPFTPPAGAGQIGTGVDVSSITRSRDEFLDTQIRKETSRLNQYQSKEEFLSAIETIFTEPSDTGLSSTLSKYWDSWNQLAMNPESSTARTLVKSNGETLADTLNHNYRQLEDLEVNIGDLIQQQSFDVANVAKQIAEVNEQIKAATIAGQVPNDLMDRRDMLLDKLSERFDFDVEKTEFNGIRIKAKMSDGSLNYLVADNRVVNSVAYVNDVKFTSGGVDIQKNDFPKVIDELPSQIELTLYMDGDINKPEKVTVSIGSINDLKKYFDVEELGGGKYSIKSIMPHTVLYDKQSYENGTLNSSKIMSANFYNGSMKGLESLSNEMNDYKKQLNNIAKTLAVSVNTIHSNSSNSAVGINFFNSDAEASDQAAKIIAVNSEILGDVNKINAGKVLNGNSGNGERALLIGQLRNTRMEMLKITDREEFLKNVFKDENGTPLTSAIPDGDSLVDKTQAIMQSNNSGTTIDNYFKSTIAQLGVSNQEAKKMVTNQEALLDQLVMRKESISGVSLDEEMTNMIQFQRTYQANAKMINVIDELLNVVVNGLIK